MSFLLLVLRGLPHFGSRQRSVILRRDWRPFAITGVTNRIESALWIKRHGGADKPGEVLSTFSNVGEPRDLSTVRERLIVVFGSPAVRVSSLSRWGREIGAVGGSRGSQGL